MNTFANRSLPVQLSLAKLFTFRWQFTDIRENGQSLQCEAVKTKDPLHLIAHTAKRLNSNQSNFLSENTYHIFKAQASSSTSTLEIKVTDRFGNVYSETMTRPKTFDINTYKK